MSAEAALQESQDRAARELARRRFAGVTWIEAGAGTGKTAVLVARVVVWCLSEGWQRNAERLQRESRLGDAPDLRRIAVEVLQRVTAITFTEAAAAEMQQRVSLALDQVRRGQSPLGCPLDDMQLEAARAAERAEALLGALDHLAVSTIHAFCRRLLANYVMDAGLHPRFAVDADESGLAAIAREVIEAQLLLAYESEGESDLFQLAL
ncbi:MAG: UvrD-helicase domain-containing protein, partial [Deltaproteobacteria bacterium]|nr:UvrD-helicase domain-containing protein [Deltaproteobacteria bacterium]